MTIDRTIHFAYTNHRGERANRTIIPTGLEWGSTPYHPEPQWLLRAFDADRGADRTYPLQEMLAPPEPDDTPALFAAPEATTRSRDIGKWAAARLAPDRTCLGVYVGDALVPGSNVYSPVVFIPRIRHALCVRGMWWRILQTVDDLEAVTDADTEGAWYVRALQDLGGTAPCHGPAGGAHLSNTLGSIAALFNDPTLPPATKRAHLRQIRNDVEPLLAALERSLEEEDTAH